MVRIGVFGLMGSGKSTVAGWFRDWGATGIDGDQLGWGVLKEPAIVESITAEFGGTVIGAEGHVDRAALGRVVFADVQAMARLNAIVQPRLLDCVREALERPRIGGKPIVLDAAMLTTWGIEPELDGVVQVTAAEATRIERVRKSRGIDHAQAATRVRGQSLPAPQGAKRLWVIENDDDLAALRARAEDVWNEIEALARS